MRQRAILALFLTTILWSVSFVAMRALNMIQGSIAPDVNSWQLNTITVALRYGLAALVVLVLWRCAGGLTRKELIQGIILGVTHGFGLLFQADGLGHTDASISAFLTQCYCVFIPLWLALRHRKFPAARAVFSIILVVAGIALLSGISWQNFKMGRGELETLLASVFFTAQILWLEKDEYRVNRPIQITFVMFATVAIMLLPLIAIQTPDLQLVAKLFAPASVWILLGVLVFFCTVGASILQNWFQPRVTSTEAGLIYCAEPVFASAVALFAPALVSAAFALDYPNEKITTNLLYGGGLILAANVLMQLKPAKP